MKYYIISELDLQDFLDIHAQGMKLSDEEVDVFYKHPVRFIGAHGEGSSLMLWGEEV